MTRSRASISSKKRLSEKKSRQRWRNREYKRQRYALFDLLCEIILRMTNAFHGVDTMPRYSCQQKISSFLAKMLSQINDLGDEAMESFRMSFPEKLNALAPIKAKILEIYSQFEPLESHIKDEIEIGDQVWKVYHRFVLERLSENCRCRACSLSIKCGETFSCDCRPDGEVVEYAFERSFNDDKCCKSCHHIATAVNCTCYECAQERDLHVWRARHQKIHEDCDSIQDRLPDFV